MGTEWTPEFSAAQASSLLERKGISVDTAKPPEEVTTVLKERGLAPSAIEGWVATPSIDPPPHRISFKEINEERTVDACELLQPFLGKEVLDRTLRTIDVLNGCSNRCDTCLADSVLPSRMFSFESLQRLFADTRFISML